MIYEIEESSSLYIAYFCQKYLNIRFNNQLRSYCELNNIDYDMLTITPRFNADKDQIIGITIRDENKKAFPTQSFDRNIPFYDLYYCNKKYHTTNPNNLMTDETIKNLGKPLKYEYYEIMDKLFLDIENTDQTIEWKIDGIVLMPTEYEDLLYSITAQLDSVLVDESSDDSG